MSDEAHIDTLTALEQNYYAGLETSNVDLLDTVFSDDLVYIHSLGLAEAKSHNLTGQRSHFHRHGPIKRVGGKSQVYGDNLAVTTGPVELVDEAHGAVRTLHLLQTLVWQREPSGWRLIFRIATRARN